MTAARRDSTRVLAYSDSKVFSGAEMVFCDLVASLARRSSLTVVAAAPSGGETARRLAAATGAAVTPVPPQPMRLGGLDLLNPLRSRAVAAALAAESPDVLLVNLPSAEYGGLPLRLEPVPGRRVGLLHVPGSPRELSFRLGRLREAVGRRVLSNLDSVLVVSGSAEEEVRRLWAPERVGVVHLRLPRPRVERPDSAAARRELGLPDGPLVGIAGRISFRQKGHDVLVAAAAELTRTQPDAHFAVAGDGRDSAALRRLVTRAGMTERFSLLGPVRPIDTFLAAIDVIAIPSRFEGLPLVALEAFAAETPGVASAVDGLRDVWPPSWQVPAGDPGALASALARVLAASPSECCETFAAGRERMLDATSPDMDAAVEAVLEPLLGVAA